MTPEERKAKAKAKRKVIRDAQIKRNESMREYPAKRNIPTDPKDLRDTFILYPFELNAKIAEPLEIKEDESLRLIANHLKVFKRCFVPTSHGKDSIVMAHLIIRAAALVDKPVPDFWLNNTLNLYAEEKPYWDKINDYLGITDNWKIFMPPKDKNGNYYTVWSIADEVGHLPNFRHGHIKNTPKDKNGKRKHDGDAPECCDILKKDNVNDHLKSIEESERYDCHFVGTRADESRNRRLGVLQRCRTYETSSHKPYAIRTVTPLSFWTDSDIWAYFKKYNIPENPSYKNHEQSRLGCASCPAHLGWELRLARDPSTVGFGMLKMNMKILKKTDQPRFLKSIDTLQTAIKKNKLKPLQVIKVNKMICELTKVNQTTLS
jgi:3'-phosphoadenosine 5'-phosphosulfate sulfotransferase (PAPS reductase)/FAD synthetase